MCSVHINKTELPTIYRKETKESLRWATRVKQVTNRSSKNSQTKQILALKAQIEKLKKEKQGKSTV